MGSNPTGPSAITHSRLKDLLDHPPADPAARAAWADQLINEFCPEMERLLARSAELEAENGQLYEENEHLRQQLAGRAAAEDAVEQRAEAFRTLAENSPDAILRLDRSLRHLYVNPAALQLTGQPSEGLIGKTISEVEIYKPILANLDLPSIRAAFDNKCELRLEIPFPLEKTYWFDVSIVPEPNRGCAPDQPAETVLVIARNITDRKEAEREFAYQHSLLETIIAAEPSGIAVVSGADFIYRMVNEAYRAILPNPEVDPLGRSMKEIWPEEDGFEGAGLIQQVVAEQASLTIERIHRNFPDGTERSFAFHARPIEWEGQPAALLIIWETTELENALEAARQRALAAAEASAEAEEGRRMLEALVEYIPEGITIASAPETRMLYVSKYTAGLGTYERSQLEGQDLQTFARLWKTYQADGVTPVTPENLPIARAARLGEVIEDEEVIVDQDGRKVNMLINAGPIRNAEGQIFAAVVTGRDITERKREESHQRFLSELGRALVTLRSPDDVVEGIVYRLGHYLNLDRCLICDDDSEHLVRRVRNDYHPGIVSLAGEYPLKKNIPLVDERLENRRKVVIADALVDPLTSEEYTGSLAQYGIRAMVAMPILDREGKLYATLLGASREPRVWQPDEINLFHSVADLASLALENGHLFQDLQDFRYRFEIGMRSAPITVVNLDRDLRITWIYNASNPLTAAAMLGKYKEDFLRPEDAAPIIKLEQEVLATGKGARREFSALTGDETRLFDTTIEPLRNSQYEIEGLVVVLVDVTDQRRMEAEAIRNLARIEVQRRLIAERELERTRIARELHDGPLQDLIAVTYNMVDAMDINEKALRLPKMRFIQEMLQKQIKELRRFCNDLRPPVLAPFGLEKTIRSHIDGLRDLYPDLDIQLNLEPDAKRLPEELRMTLFRVYQELINNVLRHSQASSVSVYLRLEENRVVLEVEDNGIGFLAPQNLIDLAHGGHLGLVGIQERVQISGGQVDLEAIPGQGTRVRVSVPR